MALNVDKVYRFVQFVSNKESRGWIDPDEFNIAAELAQIAVYSRLENYFLSNKRVHNDMRPFLKLASASYNVSLHDFPANFRQFLSARDSSGNEIIELTQAELSAALNSEIIAPTTSYPACVIRDDGIHVYPGSINTAIQVEYIAGISTPPQWVDTGAGSRPIYDSGNSDDFEFEDNLFLEIASNVLMHVGLNLNQDAVTQYGIAFNKQA